MSQNFPSASVAGAAGLQNVGEGIAWLPPSPHVYQTHRYYNRRVGGMMDDMLNLNPRDEYDLAQARGSLNSASSSGAGGNTTPGIGRAQAKLIPESAIIANTGNALTGANLTWVRLGSSSGQLYLPMPGIVGQDEFTFIFFINPRTGDLTTLGTQNLLLLNNNAWQQQVIVSFTAPSTLQAQLTYWDFTQQSRPVWTSAISTIAVGDFPQNQGNAICVSFDSTGGLILTAGANLKQGTPSTSGSPVASRLQPWWGYIAIPFTNGNDANIDFTIPQVGRYTNNAALFGPDAGFSAGSGIVPGANWRFKSRPKITVNASVTAGAWPKHIGGTCNLFGGNQYTAVTQAGWPLCRMAEEDDQANTTQAAWTVITDTVSGAANANGLTNLRASTAANRAIGGGANPTTTVGIDFSHFDATWLSLYNGGVDVHGMIGYTPSNLQGAGGRKGPAASNSDYGLWASAVVGRMLYLQGQSTGSGKLVDVSFWNEPDQGNGAWNSTVDQHSTSFSGNGTVGTGTSVTGFVINGGQAPENGMGVYIAGSMGAGVITISSVSGTGPYAFTLSRSVPNGATYMRGLPAVFGAMYLACAQQVNSDQIAAGNATPPVINPVDGPADPSSVGISTSTVSSQPFSFPWWETCAYNAKANSLPVDGLMFHDYAENDANMNGGIAIMKSLASTAGYASAIPRNTEWALSNHDPFGWYLADSLTNWDDRVTNSYAAAFIHAHVADLIGQGADMGAFFGAFGVQAFSGVFPDELFDNSTTNGIPMPAFVAFALIWKHHYQNGFLTSPLLSPVTTNWPNLRALCSKGTNANGKIVVTLTYSSFRPAGGTLKARCNFDIDWSLGAGLPTTFTWKQWQVDETSRRVSRIPLIAQDQSATANKSLPYVAEGDWLHMGCIQIIES